MSDETPLPENTPEHADTPADITPSPEPAPLPLQLPAGCRTLREIIAGSGISATQFRRIAIDLATSLAEHHEQGLTHGSLTPDSIVITPQGEALIVGFAQEPSETFDPQADLAAVGRILYELATGHAAPVAPSPADTAAEGADISRLPEELRPVVSRALAGSYQSARELSADLYAIGAHAPVAVHPPPEHRNYLLVVAAILLIAAVAAWWSRARSGGARASRHAVTVVWINNLSQDRSLGWLSRGLPDIITTGLEQVQGVEVISLERQVEALIHNNQKLGQLANYHVALDIARESGADLAVTGALLRDGPSRLRLDLRVQDTAGGRTRSEFKLYAENANDIARLADAAVKEVAGSILGSRAPSQWPVTSQFATSNPEALHHYLVAEEAIYGAVQPAVKEYEQAAILDPSFALAKFRLAELYCRAGGPRQCYEYLTITAKLQDHLPRRERLRLPLDFAALGGDPVARRHALENLLAAFPRDTEARNELSLLLSLSNNPSDAVKLVQQGLELDPDDFSLLNQMVYATAMAGDEAACKNASDRYIKLQPGDTNAFDTRGETLFILGRNEEALTVFRKLLEEKPDFGGYSSYQKIALILADQGSYEDAAAALNEYEAHASAEEQRVAPLYQARLAEAMGNAPAAMEGYLRGANALGLGGNTIAAGGMLMSLANVAILSAIDNKSDGAGNVARALAMVKTQKLLGDELPAQAWLQGALHDDAGARESLRQYFALRPWISQPRRDLLTGMVRVYSALLRHDNAAANEALKNMPSEAAPWLLYARGLAGDSPALRRALITGRALFLPPPLDWPSPFRQRLIREKLGMAEPTAKPSKSGTVHL